MKYEIGDEEFSSKAKAIERRILLNKDIERANKQGSSPINLINRVLRGNGKWIVRARTKKRMWKEEDY